MGDRARTRWENRGRRVWKRLLEGAGVSATELVWPCPAPGHHSRPCPAETHLTSSPRGALQKNWGAAGAPTGAPPASSASLPPRAHFTAELERGR